MARANTKAKTPAKAKAKAKAPVGRRVPAARAVDYRRRQLPVGDRDDDEEDRQAPAPPPPPSAADPVELGPIVMPAPADAHRILRELAQLYDDRHAAMRTFAEHKGKAKLAADTVARLSERIAERIRVTTHETGLPLFVAFEGDE